MSANPVEQPEISIHPLKPQNGVLVKVTPPKTPAQLKTAHVPCDIVLVLDVSASMGSLAPVVNPGERDENTGCSVIDIVKHAALTIMHTLDKNDRLGLVTFSHEAKVLRELSPMTVENKAKFDAIIRGLRIEASTNLWQGVEKGLGLFSTEADSGKVPALMVLTDGQPNQGEPAEGYTRALQAWGSLPTAIYTFGFGADVMSGLLTTIAEIGRGYYGFIPNSNVVCTVIVNAVAHLQSTFATKCCLDVKVDHPLEEKLDMSTRQALGMKQVRQFGRTSLSIPLGNIQYGQSREIYLRFYDNASNDCVITAQLTYSEGKGARSVEGPHVPITQASTLSDDEMAFHRNRTRICSFIVRIFPRDSQKYIGESGISANRVYWFEHLVNGLSAKSHQDAANQALEEQVQGQMRLAVYADDKEWKCWGRHYLLSVWAAHAKQLRTTFLDPGVQMYDADSPLFLACQARLIKAFEEEVVPPTPSRPAEADFAYSSGSKTLSMQSYSGRSLMHSQTPFSTSSSNRRRLDDSWDHLDSLSLDDARKNG